MEIWKEIKGYEGRYEVSNLGRIKSLNYKRTGVNRILKCSVNHNGYVRVTLRKPGECEYRLVHVLVAETFLGIRPNDDYEVDHINTIRTDNRVANIRWVNRSQNMMNPITRNKLIQASSGKHWRLEDGKRIYY